MGKQGLNKSRLAKSKSPKPSLPQTEALADLNDKQRAFVEHYLACWNGAEAARRAGYSVKTAREQASDLLTKPNIKAAIAQRIAELKMSADEVLLRLADHARGSIEHFMDGQDEFSLAEARKQGKMHLVKKLKRTKRTEHRKDGDPVVTTTTEVELHDPQAALVQLGRANALFTDKVAPVTPDGQHEYTGLTDDERMARLAALAERARTRRAGRAPKND